MIRQAVILAGGKGKRLLPLTKNIPKPMALVNNIPFLSYLIYSLKKRGIKKILILVGYKSRKIINFYSLKSKNIVSQKFSIGISSSIFLSFNSIFTNFFLTSYFVCTI